MTNINTLYGTPNTRAGLAESPVWDDAASCWYWIDIPNRQIHRHTLDDAHTLWQLPQTDASDPGALCICTDGTLIVALRAGLARFDPATPAGDVTLAVFLDAPYDTSTIRFNDGGVDAAGRFWVGSLFAPKTHNGASLYCLEKGTLHTALGEDAPHAPQNQWGTITSNGWAMSPDGHRVHHADTQAHTSYIYDFDANQPIETALSNRRAFYQSQTQAQAKEAGTVYQGRPDGAAVDSAGNYWNAQFEGGQVVQLSPTGDIIQRLMLPARCPTMVCFGGADLKTLIITTAGNRPESELAHYPTNGHILTLKSDTAGLAPQRYRSS